MDLTTPEGRMQHLLKQIGWPGQCRGCAAQVLWVTHRGGAKTPYDPDGMPHFATCPEAKRFKKEKPDAR